jgi:hypothetical protein
MRSYNVIHHECYPSRPRRVSAPAAPTEPACTWASGVAWCTISGLRSAAALIAAPSPRWGLSSNARPATGPRLAVPARCIRKRGRQSARGHRMLRRFVEWCSAGNLLPLCPRHARKIHRPGQRRAAPTLPDRRPKLRTLVDPANAQSDSSSRVRLRRGGIDWRATICAEGMCALVPAFGGLDVNPRGPALQHERPRQGRNVGPKCCAGQPLAICAMADPDGGRIDLGLVRDLPAVTAAGHFHRLLRSSDASGG